MEKANLSARPRGKNMVKGGPRKPHHRPQPEEHSRSSPPSNEGERVKKGGGANLNEPQRTIGCSKASNAYAVAQNRTL